MDITLRHCEERSKLCTCKSCKMGLVSLEIATLARNDALKKLYPT
jgi:hypothetical protein